jgi:O-antigen/teichoic acid export membrane protein
MVDELVKVAEDAARGGFFLISGSAFATIILAIGSIMIARILNPELYGQYSLVIVVPQIIFLFTDLGISQGITKFVADARASGENAQVAKIIKHGLMLRMLMGVALFFATYFFADFFASFFLQRPELGFYVRISSISILFQVIFTTATSAFVGMDKTEYNAVTTNIQAISKAIAQIGFVLLGFAVAGAVLGHVFSFLFGGVIGIALLFFIVRKNKDSLSDKYSFTGNSRQLLKYGAPLYVSVLLVGLIPFYQNVMLALFVTNTDIGNYKAAINFAALLTVFSIPITTAMLPAFAKLGSAASDKMKLFFKLTNKYVTLIILPIAVLIILLSKEIIQIVYGSEYQSAPFFLAIYCVLYLLVGFGNLTLLSFYNGIGETKITMRIGLITFTILVFLSPVLTQFYGVEGLIVAFLLASVVGQIYSAFFAVRKYKVEFDTRAILKIYLISGLSCILPVILIELLAFPNTLNVLFIGLLYLLIYITIIPVFRTLNLVETKQAVEVIQNVRFLSSVAKPVLKYQEKILKRVESH